MLKDQYKIWMTQGQGGAVITVRYNLEDALAFVKENTGSGSFGIEKPDGTWHDSV